MSGPAAPDPIFNGLPGWAQLAASGGVFLAAVVAGFYGFWRQMRPQALVALGAPQSETAQAAVVQLTRIADAMEKVFGLLQDEVHEREIEKRVQEEVKRRMGDH